MLQWENSISRLSVWFCVYEILFFFCLFIVSFCHAYEFLYALCPNGVVKGAQRDPIHFRYTNILHSKGTMNASMKGKVLEEAS